MSTLLRKQIQSQIQADLKNKMVFLGGPRQVGKTTLAKSLLKNRQGHGYFNWDFAEDKSRILNKEWPAEQKLIVFDEIHKYSRWRNLIKGYYDNFKNQHQFLVTGSARLDLYRKGGDSLLGRYHYHRLHPFSYPELNDPKSLELLLKFGGFPEPLVQQSEVFLKRWQKERRERVIYSDVRDLENLKEISMLDLLVDALPERIGSPLSKKSLSEDLQVAQQTVERWIQILENVYYCYRISPFGAAKIRAVKKEQKLYLWDWTECVDKGALWENFIASHLLKYCHHLEDTRGEKMELRFLRDTDKREVDFVVLKNKKPQFAVECKSGEKNISPHLEYFAARTNIPIFYQVHDGQRERQITDRIRLLPFKKFAEVLPLV